MFSGLLDLLDILNPSGCSVMEFDTEVLENVLELCDLYRDRERKKSAPSVFTYYDHNMITI